MAEYYTMQEQMQNKNQQSETVSEQEIDLDLSNVAGSDETPEQW